MSDSGLTSLRIDIRVGHVDLLVRDGDPMRTVFFLHGIGGRASSFSDVMQRWPQGPRLIAWDMPGYGGSTVLPFGVPGAFSFAHALNSVLQALPGQFTGGRIDLVGQSLGGLVAGVFTAMRRGFVRRLTLVSPAIGYGTAPDAPLPAALQKRLTDFEAEGPAAFAAKRAPRLVFDPDKKPGVVAAVRLAMETLNTPGHSQAVHYLARGNLLEVAHLIHCPVLLVSGSEDIITPLAGTKTLLDVLRERPRSPMISERLVDIPQAGHAAYLEAPGAFIAAIVSFLAEAGP